MSGVLQGELDATGIRLVILVSRFNEAITSKLLDGAKAALARRGARERDLTVVSVPGAWELPLAAKGLAESGRFDAMVALGCVIRGETTHHEHVGGQAAAGLCRVSLETGMPIGFGLLTVNTEEQALERAGGGEGNKGEDAALAAVELVQLMRQVKGTAR